MESERDSSVTSRKSSYVEKEEKESKTNPVLIGSAVLAALGIVLVIIWFLTWNSTTNELPEAQSLKAERTNSSHPQTQTENAVISAQNPGSSPHRQKKVCKTRECIALSHQLNNFGDKSVDPCVNFYQHACGRYTEQLNADTLGLWKTKLVEKVINEYLYKNRNVGTNSTSERIIKQMFGLCLKMENNENEFFETFYRDVWADVQKVGLWPMIDQKFNESTFNLARYLENMSEKLDMVHFGLFKLATYSKTIINEDEESLDRTSSEEKKQLKSLASFNNFQIDES
uniref:Peptidase M13 N-terminal domain-containing protein n=1 Tax=Caenorhabditis japonica TaxID=281687 RepID=A0A8R1HLV4_CAEJA